MNKTLLVLAVVCALLFAGVDARKPGKGKQGSNSNSGKFSASNRLSASKQSDSDEPTQTAATTSTSATTATLTVGSCRGDGYATIASALAAVTEDGQTILLCPQYFEEDVTVSSRPVEIRGTRTPNYQSTLAGSMYIASSVPGTTVSGVTFINSATFMSTPKGEETTFVTISASGVTFENNTFLTNVTSYDSIGVDTRVESVIIRNNTFRIVPAAESSTIITTDNYAIYFDDFTPNTVLPVGADLLIENNFINLQYGIYVESPVNGVTIRNNTFLYVEGNGGSFIVIGDDAGFFTIVKNYAIFADDATGTGAIWLDVEAYFSNSTISNNYVDLRDTKSEFIYFNDVTTNVNITSNTAYGGPVLDLNDDLHEVRISRNAFYVDSGLAYLIDITSTGYVAENLQVVVNQITYIKSMDVTSADDTSIINPAKTTSAQGNDFRLSPNVILLIKDPKA